MQKGPVVGCREKGSWIKPCVRDVCADYVGTWNITPMQGPYGGYRESEYQVG